MRALMIAVVAVLLAACGQVSVDYDVTGTAALVDITYADGDSIEQVNGITPPWATSIDAEKDDFVYLSAQNQTDSGTVRVKITYSGTFSGSGTIDAAESSGPFAIATASGSVP